MILQGNQRGGAKDLAQHLLKDENEHVDVHELRGFVADDLVGALNEAYAVSRGTKAKQFLFSLSLNPPPQENVSTKAFEDAINRVEQKLGLTDQPRAIVFHEKNGRRHAHAVWSRTDTENMKAIPLPHTKRKLAEVSRKLYLEHGWQMPRGFMNSQERDLKNFTHKQWQQAKRVGKDPREIMSALQDCWAVSDSQAAFAQALKERGYTLARGDRRGFVALDHKCEVFAVSKWVGIKAKDMRSKLTDQEALPSVDKAKEEIARDMAKRLTQLQAQQNAAIKARQLEIEEKRLRMAQEHEAKRQELKSQQQLRWQTETLYRQQRLRSGLRGLMDRVTGHRREIIRQNETEALQAMQRDQHQRDSLIFQQLEQRRSLQQRIQRLRTLGHERHQSLSRDINQYREMKVGKRDAADFRGEIQKQRNTTDFKQRMQNRTREGPERER